VGGGWWKLIISLQNSKPINLLALVIELSDQPQKMELRKNQQLEKLEKRVQDGNYYEAQQMYKTINSRFVHKAYYLHNLGVCGAHDLNDAI
jgi:hypothetical protein